MITDVKLSGIDTTVGEVRALFANEHVHSAVIVRGGRLASVVDRDDLPGPCSDAVAAVAVGRRDGRVVSPDTGLRLARALLVRSGRRRLAVVGTDDEFLGLLCLKRTGRSFCANSDVRARSEAARFGSPIETVRDTSVEPADAAVAITAGVPVWSGAALVGRDEFEMRRFEMGSVVP